MGPISSWLLGEESWAGLGWAGVCVSSHEGDDVCVYVAIVAMSLQYLHEPQCSNVSSVQVRFLVVEVYLGIDLHDH